MADRGDEVGLQYWLQWQVPICFLFLAGPAVGAAVVIKKARPEPLRSSDLWVPCWRSLHPLWLLAFRTFAMVVMCWVLYDSYLVFGPLAYYYTIWAFILEMFYFAIAISISVHGCWKYWKQLTDEYKDTHGSYKRKLEVKSHETIPSGPKEIYNTIKSKSYNEPRELEGKAGFWGYLMQIIYQTCGGAAMLTNITFWGLLVPFMSSHVFSSTRVMIFLHSLNAIFLLLDTALNRLDFPWFRIAYFILLSCIYITYHWISYACFAWWPYPFLNLETPWAPLWYFSMTLVHIPCYGLYYFIARAKKACFPNGFPHVHVKTH